MKVTRKLENPGDVVIEVLKIISTRGLVVDLEDYLVEFNLYEEIFSPCMHGSIILTDKRNLVTNLPIIGQELLVVKFTTPTFPSSIEKTFRITKITDRHIVMGQNAHMYTLHFVSQEITLDMNAPIFKSFEGKIDDVVSEIFSDFVSFPRSLVLEGNEVTESLEGTPCKILTETSNNIKFISPGWSAFKCINWLASKSIPNEGAACNFLFWESNKCFYFANLETIFKQNYENQLTGGTYHFIPSNIRTTASRDVLREMFITDSVETVVGVDQIRNYVSGYLSNQLIELDIVNKKYQIINYDHTNRFDDYFHISGPDSMPLFSRTGDMAAPQSNIKFHSKHPKLFNNFEDNISEVFGEKHGNRLSNMLELDNFKLNLYVPGRTDIECGQMINFKYPDVQPTDSTDKLSDRIDPFYSGTYLITGIRHQINAVRHKMVLEITKDSLSGADNKYSGIWT